MKTVVITGASRGIGFATVKALLNLNCKVIALSRNSDVLVDLQQTIADKSQLECITFDSVNDTTASLDKILGNTSIDVLINNAGLVLNKPFETISQDELKQVFDVNVFGLFKITQYLLPKLTQTKGTVLNISSMGGVNGSSKFPGLSAYSASKGAVSILTECLAEEFKEKGVHVNALAIGAVQTEMLAEAFPGYLASVQPQEMGAYIANFVINEARLFNGKIIQVSNSTP